MFWRLASIDDCDEIIYLVNLGYRGDIAKIGWTTEAGFISGPRIEKKEYQELMENEFVSILVFGETESCSPPISCIKININRNEVEFGMFTVSPYKQNKGIGKFVLEEAEKYSVEKLGANSACMYVINIRHELLAFYSRRGYNDTGELLPFPYNENC
ncbi:hypothetical protein HK096_002087, partial [Nowakowskiella sp. JEL0078]